MDKKSKQAAKEVIDSLFIDVFNNILNIEEHYIKKESNTNITINEVHILDAIDLSIDTSIGSIAKRLAVTISTLSISLNKLISKGLVVKCNDSTDKRIQNVRLTTKAKDILEYHCRFHKSMARRSIEGAAGNEEKIIKSLENLRAYFLAMKDRYLK